MSFVAKKLGKKLMLLRRLKTRMASVELGRVLPLTAKQIERLTNFKRPSITLKANGSCFANAMVFFVSDSQQQVIEKALSLAEEPKEQKLKAAKKAAALSAIASYFLSNSKNNFGVLNNG